MLLVSSAPALQAALLLRLHPATTAEQARCLLALMAAGTADSGSGGSGGVTLPGIKAALAMVLEAQQFPVRLWSGGLGCTGGLWSHGIV